MRADNPRVTDTYRALTARNGGVWCATMRSVQGRGRPRSTSPTREGRNTRAEILDAAAELITLQGFGGTTTRQIAEAVGVRQNVLYHHFGSKEQILGSLLEALVCPALEAAEALAGVQAYTADDAAARLYALAFHDANVLATWRWNLGVLFALPEANSAAFHPAHQMRAQLRGHYREFTESVATHTGVAAAADHPFRLVESIAAIRADGQLNADTPHELALGCLRLAGRVDRLAAVVGQARALWESLGAPSAPELR